MIKRAEEKDIPMIESILLDAVQWMKNANISNRWTETNIKWENLSKQYRVEDFYLYYLGKFSLGCIAVTNRDQENWPENMDGEAYYIHKLAVKKEFTGLGVGKILVDHAKELAKEKGAKSICLDFNLHRRKLKEFYEGNGFHVVREIKDENGYDLALYECSIAD